MEKHPIVLKNVRVHNLKGVDLELPAGELVVFTGVSGSGKSSLAFDTLYVEGQRRYIESLSQQARKELGSFSKPDLDFASGITPTIAIEQKTKSLNPRSTVGTLTEIYDFLRVLFAKIGQPHCPVTGKPLKAQSRDQIISTIQIHKKGEKCLILAPLFKGKKGELKEEIDHLKRKGFLRARLDKHLVHLEDSIQLDGKVAHDLDLVIDRLSIEDENKGRLAEALELGLEWGKGVVVVLNSETGQEELFSLQGYSEETETSYGSLEPQDFSFNSPEGMCPTCFGLGTVQDFDLKKVINPELSISEDCCSIASSFKTVRWSNIYQYLADKYEFSVHTPWKKLPKKAQDVFLYGTGNEWQRIQFIHPETGATWVDHIQWKGVFYEAKERYSEATSDLYKKKVEALMVSSPCSSCKSARIKPYPAACKLGNKTLLQLVELPISDLLTHFETLSLSREDTEIGEELVKEVKERLQFLQYVGLGYLNLNRPSPTLSGGEAQRVRLASQIGSGLVGVTYILDEPSIGLHPQDNGALIATLKALKERGNRVLVVEHDEETILSADRIVDIGPGPGVRGGEILVNGSFDDLLKCEKSVTGAFFRGDRKIPLPKKIRKKKGALEIEGASHHNLKGIDVAFPLGCLVAVTGVSGCGKSSLLLETLYPLLSNHIYRTDLEVGPYKKVKGLDLIDKVIGIDQTPIGKNPRSNPGTYIKVFDLIRELFASLPDSQIKGFDKGRFSFNVKDGCCSTCQGMGMIRVDMDFLEEAWVECPTCKGSKFDQETLSITYKGKNISEILSMEVGDLLEFFSSHPLISHHLRTLKEVGLDYIKLGQPSPTLSGGEAQRVKLAKELLRPSTGHTVYLLDEPTTGLHLADIEKLLVVLHRLVDEGNTVILIEHNMEMVKTADWVIELGPSGGHKGGELIGAGPPKKIVSLNTPTGKALAPFLKGELMKPPVVPHQDVPQDTGLILIKGARQNNLKNLSLEIPRGAITVFTGPSGAGKSSLALETLFAEGQRRYTDSLSPYARQFISQMPKPKVESIEGLLPAIAIEQKANSGNLRSTIGTMTEIHDYLRILYAELGTAYNPSTGNRLQEARQDSILQDFTDLKEGTPLFILAPIHAKRGEAWVPFLKRWQSGGFQRIYLDGIVYHLDDPELPIEKIPFDPKQKHALFLVVDRMKWHPSEESRLLEGIATASKIGKKHLAFLVGDDLKSYFLDFADPITGESFPPLTSRSFAFNLPEGYCPSCSGTGQDFGARLLQEEEVGTLSLEELFNIFFGSNKLLKALSPELKKLKINTSLPLLDLSNSALNFLLKGQEKTIPLKEGGAIRWIGLEPALERLAKIGPKQVREILSPLMELKTCSVCEGSRLNPIARAVKLAGETLPKLSSLPLDDLIPFFEQLKTDNHYLEEVRETILKKLQFLSKIGVGYLSLDRSSTSLSGGEVQRVRLARQLVSGLTGVLYVLDEPTTGLHPRDVEKLNDALVALKQEGNTLVVVEHDIETMKISDFMVEFGPKGGSEGGFILAKGSLKEVINNPNSLTGPYITGQKTLSADHKKRIGKSFVELKKGKLHNLKGVNLKIPKKCLTAITGVSGSGKSSLVQDLLAPLAKTANENEGIFNTPLGSIEGVDFDQIVLLDQNPVGQTARSDVGTYVELLPKIRSFFSLLPEAVAKGLKPSYFSTNHLKGMCSNCYGLGYKKVDLLFLPAVRVHCDVCHGKRLNPLSLGVLYKGYSFGDILKLSVKEAISFFEAHPSIKIILETLNSVGLNYLTIGQEVQSLSLGESQRLKLAREILKGRRGKSLFLLDEPTLGLHFSDVEKLLVLFQELVDRGHTIVVIEHHLGVIEAADYVIELGPGAGTLGGQIVATGTPEELIKNPNSPTGPFLKQRIV